MTAGIPVVGDQDVSDFDDREEAVRANERAVLAGEIIEERQFVDYFAEPEAIRWYLPDGTQYFEFQELREGGKAAYERATNKDIRVQRSTGDARLQVDPATARQKLIQLSVVDCCLYQSVNGRTERITFNKDRPGKFWENLFNRYPAKIVEQLHQEITKANTWLAADDDVDALVEERDRLDERIDRAREEQEKGSSS